MQQPITMIVSTSKLAVFRREVTASREINDGGVGISEVREIVNLLEIHILHHFTLSCIGAIRSNLFLAKIGRFPATKWTSSRRFTWTEVATAFSTMLRLGVTRMVRKGLNVGEGG